MQQDYDKVIVQGALMVTDTTLLLAEGSVEPVWSVTREADYRSAAFFGTEGKQA